MTLLTQPCEIFLSPALHFHAGIEYLQVLRNTVGEEGWREGLNGSAQISVTKVHGTTFLALRGGGGYKSVTLPQSGGSQMDRTRKNRFNTNFSTIWSHGSY